jgi:hypothetical protein
VEALGRESQDCGGASIGRTVRQQAGVALLANGPMALVEGVMRAPRPNLSRTVFTRAKRSAAAGRHTKDISRQFPAAQADAKAAPSTLFSAAEVNAAADAIADATAKTQEETTARENPTVDTTFTR